MCTITMSISATDSRPLSVRRTDSVASSPRVRHVDELTESARERFYELVTSGTQTTTSDPTEFVDGEVIVFTDYYRVTVC